MHLRTVLADSLELRENATRVPKLMSQITVYSSNF